MSDVEEIKARNEQLMAAFAVILTHKAMFHITVGSLWIDRLADGRFSVAQMIMRDGRPEAPAEEFDEARDAIAYFLDLLEQRTMLE